MPEHWLALSPAGKAVVGAWIAVLLALGLLAMHRYSLALAARRARRREVVGPPLPAELPVVTVQLPVFNEANVVERLLDAASRLDWPKDRLEIQVLDDSTDATGELVDARVAWMRRDGLDAHHLRRSVRAGYKAGALAAGLERARGDLIAVFDADFVPPPDFLVRLAGHFSDPAVACVQARWGHLNRRQSLLTRIQAVLLDGHFLVEQTARAARGHPFNFNGTAGIWRRGAIAAAGGWQADTLTEDLDLSYRAQMRGGKLVFRPDVVAPAELPADIEALLGQQHRWAEGSIQTARKLLACLLRSPLPLAARVEGALHLLANLSWLLLLLLALLTGPALACRLRDGWTQTLVLDLPFFLFATGSLAAFYAAPLAATGEGWRRWRLLPAAMALGIGLSVSNSLAVLRGLLRRGGEFRRTPKLGLTDGGGGGGPVRYRAGRNPGVLVEAALALWFALLFGWAASEGLWPSLPWLALLGGGFAAVTALRLAARHRAGALCAAFGRPAAPERASPLPGPARDAATPP